MLHFQILSQVPYEWIDHDIEVVWVEVEQVG